MEITAGKTYLKCKKMAWAYSRHGILQNVPWAQNHRMHKKIMARFTRLQNMSTARFNRNMSTLGHKNNLASKA
jgi:hypothetical protein